MDKTCTKCQVTKPLEDFYAAKKYKGGYHTQCKACMKVATMAWQKANPERVKASVKKWQEANPEKVRASIDKWQKANPEKLKASVKKWQKNNPLKVAEYLRRRADKLVAEAHAYATE